MTNGIFRVDGLLTEGGLVAGTTAGHGPMPLEVAQSFSPKELACYAEDERTAMIVHHGEVVGLPHFRRVHAHIEVAIVFSNRPHGRTHVSAKEIINGLTKEDRHGGGWDSLTILRHGGMLNRKVLQFVLNQAGGGELADRDERSFGNYAELAAAGLCMPNALIIGLRGQDAGRPELQPVVVDGVDPLDPIARSRYPLQYNVHIYLRDEQQAFDRKQMLYYLHEIRQRIAHDQLAIFKTNRHVSAQPGQFVAA